jgi:hypothetical protein
MKKNSVFVVIIICVVAASSGLYFLSHKTNHTCNNVKKVIIPSDVRSIPADVVTGQDAVNTCKQQGLDAMGEGGKYIYEF